MTSLSLPFHTFKRLDGLKAGPIKLGIVADDESWWNIAKPAVEARMQRYSQEENSFTLLSVCEQRSSILERNIDECQGQLEELSFGSGAEIQEGTTAATLRSKLDGLQSELEDEQCRLRKQKEENIRRRHNFCPFIIALLRALATNQGVLEGLIERAKERKGISQGTKR